MCVIAKWQNSRHRKLRTKNKYRQIQLFYNNTIIVGDFNVLCSLIDVSYRQKISSKDKDHLNNSLNQRFI